MQSLTQDWAAWDYSYAFIEDANTEFITSNLHNNTFESLSLNFMIFVNRQGEIVHGGGYDLEAEAPIPIPADLQQQLTAQSPLMQFPHLAYHHQGLIPVDDKLLLVVVEPILRSDTTGPAKGALLMGRYLDEKVTETLAERTRLNLQISPLAAQGMPNKLKSIVEILTAQGKDRETAMLIQPQSATALASYAVWHDLYDNPQALLQVMLPRDIYRQGQISLFYLGIALLMSCLVFTVSILLLLDRAILKRLLGLSAAVQHIGRSNDLTERVNVSGNDELSQLSHRINDMLGELQISHQKLAEEQQKAEQLLLNILPAPIADELMQSQASIPQHFDEVTILFADIVGFTKLANRLSPINLVALLNQIFSAFDSLAEQLGLEKIKTIGDAYMVAAGLPTPRDDHAEAIAEMALAMQQITASLRAESGEPLKIRIGINTGVVVAGVIGTKKFIYDLWGDAVNVASRMEASSEPGLIQVTAATYERLNANYILDKRGYIAVKGRGEMETYWLRGRRADELLSPSSLITQPRSTHI